MSVRNTINHSTIYPPIKTLQLVIIFLTWEQSKGLSDDTPLHRTRPRPHREKWGTPFWYRLRYKGSNLASYAKLNIFNQRDWLLVLFFIMAHSDLKVPARKIILTLKILIYKQAIKIISGAKFVNINTLMRKWLQTQTKTQKLLLQLPVCDLWCTQVKNIHSNTLQTFLAMSWKTNST